MTTSTKLHSERLAAVLPLQLLRQQIDALLGQVEGGVRTIDSILLSDDFNEATRVVYICKLIEVVPGMGKVAARQILAHINVSETEPTGNLTTEKRKQLVELIASRAVVQ